LEHNNFLFEFVNYILNSSDNKSIIQRYGVYKRLLDCVNETKLTKIHAKAEAIHVEAESIHAEAEAEAIHVEAESSYKYTKLFETDLNRVFSDSGKLGKTVSTKRNQNGHLELFTDLNKLFLKSSDNIDLTDKAKQALNLASIDKYADSARGFTSKKDDIKDPFLGLEKSYHTAMSKEFPEDFNNPYKKSSCFPWCPWGGTRNKRNKRNKRHKKTLRKK
jgi:hypothetical protein